MASFTPKKFQIKDGCEIVIRPPQEGDAPGLLALNRALFENGQGQVLLPNETKLSLQKEQEWITKHRDDPRAVGLVAELPSENLIVGELDFRTFGPKQMSHRGRMSMGLLPRWRGMRIGSYLMQTFIELLPTLPGVERVTLGVLSDNPAAQALYQRHGFREVGRDVQAVKYVDGGYCDDIRMELLVSDIDRKSPS